MIVYVKTQGARVIKEGRHLLVKKGDGIYNTLFTYKLDQWKSPVREFLLIRMKNTTYSESVNRDVIIHENDNVLILWYILALHYFRSAKK